MAKHNVHTASRDELAEAGVRADLVDEILKRRRRKGGITLESLGEVSGVGPATLEQLGKALDFQEPPSEEAAGQDKPQPSRNERPSASERQDRDERPAQQAPRPAEPEVSDTAEATLRAGTEQAAELVAATVQAGAEATGRAAEAARDTVEAGVRAAGQGTRAGLQVVQRTAEAAEGAQREVTEDASAFGRSFLELLQEQGRENLAAMTALSRAQGLDEVVRVQGEYLRGTLERLTELNRRWLELAGTMWPGAALGEDRGGGEGGSAAR